MAKTGRMNALAIIMSISTAFLLLIANPIIIFADYNNFTPGAKACKDTTVSPWAFWNDSDSLDIKRNQMLARYECFRRGKSEEILSYYGSTLWTRVNDLVVYDGTLYGLNINGVQVFDLTDAANPTLVNEIYLGYANEYALMSLQNGYLYVPRNDRLHIFDISDPQNPQEVRVLILAGAIMDVHVENNRLYCGLIRYSGEYENYPALYIYDVSNPVNPQVVGKYESASFHKDCRMFTVAGDYIYSINHWDQQMEVISIVDESHPIQTDTHPMSYPRDITHYDDFLLVSSDDTLLVYDISSPGAATLLFSYETSTYYALEADADRLYAGGNDSHIIIYDIDVDGSLDSIGFYGARYYWYSLEIADTLLFLPEKWQGFSIVDVSDPANTEAIAVYSYDCSSLMGLDAEGDYVYLTNYMSFIGGPSYNGLYTVDASDLQNPVLVDYDYIGGNTNSVHVTDSLAFVAECQPTNIYSLSNPANPQFLAQYPEDWHQTKCNLAQDTILYVTRRGNLDVVNISDPANPENISITAIDSLYMYKLMLSDNLLYMGSLDLDGLDNKLYLLTIDISDLSNPVCKNEILIDTAFPSSCEMVKRGSYLYFTAADACLYILDISDPTMPDKAGHYITLEEDP